LLEGTCFSVEPGVYLPNEFGVRLEVDVLIHHDGKVEVTGGEQNAIAFMQLEPLGAK
jgi:Xaa-Pro aminopeptidase